MSSRAFVRAHINGSPVRHWIRRLELRHQDDRHTVGELDVEIPWPYKAMINPAREMSPVILDYGWGPHDATQWAGYVHDTQAITATDDKTVVLRHTLIGTSHPLDTERTRTWQGVSATTIARMVAKEHRLRAVVQRQSPRLGHWTQAGISDFALLRDLSERTGFRLYVDRSTLFFHDPRYLVSGPSRSRAPRFTQNKTPGVLDTLRTFSSSEGTQVPRDARTRRTVQVHGVDRRTGRTIRAQSGSDPFVRVRTDRAVSSLSEADMVADADALRAQNWITAEASTAGSTSLRPGRLVGFDGVGLNQRNVGEWLIRKATHVITPNRTGIYVANDYSTDLTVVRNVENGVEFLGNTKSSGFQEYTPVTLNDQGIWEANFVEELRVG